MLGLWMRRETFSRVSYFGRLTGRCILTRQRTTTDRCDRRKNEADPVPLSPLTKHTGDYDFCTGTVFFGGFLFERRPRSRCDLTHRKSASRTVEACRENSQPLESQTSALLILCKKRSFSRKLPLVTFTFGCRIGRDGVSVCRRFHSGSQRDSRRD